MSDASAMLELMSPSWFAKSVLLPGSAAEEPLVCAEAPVGCEDEPVGGAEEPFGCEDELLGGAEDPFDAGGLPEFACWRFSSCFLALRRLAFNL